MLLNKNEGFLKNFFLRDMYPAFILSIALLTLSSCGHLSGSQTGYYKIGAPYTVEGKVYTPKDQPDYDEVGMASWYGSDFHKKVTANGGTFDRNALTAAHKTLPLPSMVRITNLSNNKTLIVMVNDRGPFSKDRIIDLSERAADILGFKDKGVAKVRVQYLPGQTKRLLSDLPGTKGKNVVAMTSPTNSNSTAAVEKTADVNTVTKLIKTADKTEVKDSQAPIVVASNTLPDLVSKPDATPKKKAKKKAKTGKKDFVKPLDDSDASSYSDVENENPSAIMSNSDIKKPAKKHEEKIEEVSQEVLFVQAGTYGIIDNAKRTEKKLAALGTVSIVPVKVNGKLLYKVKVGPILDKQVAELTLKKVITLGHPDAMLVKENSSTSVQ